MGSRALALTWVTLLLCGCGDDADTSIDAGGHDAAVDGAGMDATLDARVNDATTIDAPVDAHDLDHVDEIDNDAAATGDGGDDAGNPGYALKLSETGLYADIANDVIAQDVIAFEPAYALWSDGSAKRRFLHLPPGSVIDTNDMDRWVFPVGTKAWKEFTRDGVRIETRLLHKTERGWLMFAYVWDEANTDADVTLLPIDNARDTDHDVPSRGQCLECHGGQPDRLLGVSALQLSHNNAGLTLAQLIADQRLSHPPSAPFTLPGDALDQQVLGMLHANCGNCHIEGTVAFERARGLDLWLRTAQLGSVGETLSYQSTVGVDLAWFEREGFAQRIAPGEPSLSALLFRMGERGNDAQMPPLGTEQVNQDAIDALTLWIDRLN